MKHLRSIATLLLLGSALTLSACGKDKKPATEPAAADPAKADPAKADPAKDPAAAGDPAKGDDKPKAAGGW
jgi:hypothetical protein